GLVGVSVIESKVPGLPPRALVARANFVANFRYAEIFSHIGICRLSCTYLTDHYLRRLIVTADEKQSCFWSELVRATRIQSSKNILVDYPHRSHPRGSLNRPFQNEIGELHHIGDLRSCAGHRQSEQASQKR